MKRGWTLDETLIVSAIIGLLVAIAIPAYKQYKADVQANYQKVANVATEFELWQKLSGRDDITFEEWKILEAKGAIDWTKLKTTGEEE